MSRVARILEVIGQAMQLPQKAPAAAVDRVIIAKDGKAKLADWVREDGTMPGEREN